ncbi:MAG: hypothetical protein MZV64_62580 [Ignavibacteriales bacterium]|nr:hypothetical protein [Ignavibacteriales bacterium]
MDSARQAGTGRQGRTDHQRHHPDREKIARTDRRRSGYLVGFARWRHPRRLCGCAPGRGTAQHCRQPGAFCQNAQRPGIIPHPEIGIAFVAMKRNIADLPKVIKIGKSLRATYFSVSNLQPATEDMQADRLYDRVTRNIAYLNAPHLPRLSLPKMDFDESTRDAIVRDLQQRFEHQLRGQQLGRRQ